MLSTSHIPHQPGIYLFKNSRDKILYIGKAKNLKKRVQQYFTPGSVRKQDMVAKAHTVEFIRTQSESEALFLESNMIKEHQPAYNSLLKGDNSYGFIKITNEKFPQIFFTRKRSEDGATYIGPKRYSSRIKHVLHYLRQLFKYRGCKTTQFRQGKLCSDYYRGICSGRCVFAKLNVNSPQARALIDQAHKQGLEIHQTYDEYVAEYQEIISLVSQVFSGKHKSTLEIITQHMDEAIAREHYERAATLRDIYRGLDQIVQKQDVVIPYTRSGRVRQLHCIGDRWVYIAARFSEGKLIDIIRHKLSHDEASLNEILTLLELEFGEALLVSISDNYKRLTSVARSESIDREDITARHQLITDQLTQGILGVAGSSSLPKKHYQAVAPVIEKALDSYIVSTSWKDESMMKELLNTLQDRYYFKAFPYHIECVDISHMSGKHTSGGLSALVGGVPSQHYYRNYRIQSVSGGDDYGALREVLIRRFKLDSTDTPHQLPDVFILDGGLRQLGIVRVLMQEYPVFSEVMQTTQFAALEKGLARKRANQTANPEILHTMLDDGDIVSTPLIYDQTDQLLVKLRDESHRFANRYRKKRYSKEMKK